MAFWQHTSFSRIVGHVDWVDRHRQQRARVPSNTYAIYHILTVVLHHTPLFGSTTAPDIERHLNSFVYWILRGGCRHRHPPAFARHSFHIHGIVEIVFLLLFFRYFCHSSPPPSNPASRHHRNPAFAIVWSFDVQSPPFAHVLQTSFSLALRTENLNVPKMRINHSKNDFILYLNENHYYSQHFVSHHMRTEQIHCIALRLSGV